ncbi:MAG: type II secretion system protein, partial [Chthoniobacterales bacterium]
MKILPRKSCAFTLAELLVVIAVLITISIPNVGHYPGSARMTQTLANARSLQQATQVMTLDHQKAGGDGIIWTSQMSEKKATPATLDAYFEAFIKGDYMT